MSAKPKHSKKDKPPEDPVRAFLVKRGASERLVEGGLNALLDEWDRVVTSIADGYPPDTLDDYLNDMDVRQILDELRDGAPRAFDSTALARLEEADWRVGVLLIPAVSCLWGKASAIKHGWRAERESSFYRSF
jgi:hypothetical protein